MKTIKVQSWADVPKEYTGIIHIYNAVYYYKKGKVHRENGFPAIEFVDGTKKYYVDGILHRIGGPAVEHVKGFKEYWINGNIVSKKAHDLLWNLIKLKKKTKT